MEKESSIVNPVTTKILRTGTGDLKIHVFGTQVTMSEKDYKYCQDAEKRSLKAQVILEKYYTQE